MFFKKIFADFGEDRILSDQEKIDQEYSFPENAKVLAVYNHEPLKSEQFADDFLDNMNDSDALIALDII